MTESTLKTHSVKTMAARNLATISKTRPQMIGITPRWSLKMLPWVNVQGGTYRVNRHKTLLPGDEKIRFQIENGEVHVQPQQLRALSLLKDADDDLLASMTQQLKSESVNAGEIVLQEGAPGEKF